MATPIIRATFGRLSNESLSRIVIGHLEIGGELVVTIPVYDWDRERRKSQGKSQKGRKKRLLLEPLVDAYKHQIQREDNELIEIVSAMIRGGLLCR